MCIYVSCPPHLTEALGTAVLNTFVESINECEAGSGGGRAGRGESAWGLLSCWLRALRTDPTFQAWHRISAQVGCYYHRRWGPPGSPRCRGWASVHRVAVLQCPH